MSNYRFSMAPNISVPRSKFKMPFNHVTAFEHGKLVPVDCFEVLPGDQFKLNLSAIIRMSTPIAPIFGNIKARVHAFFVPMRLIWEHTKEFYGENKTSSGYQTYNYTIPKATYGASSTYFSIPGSISNYLGKPLQSASLTYGSTGIDVSVLKERGYCLIWSEYYRAQQLQNPVLLNVGDTGAIGTYTDGSTDNNLSSTQVIGFQTKCLNVCKEFDYFTACTLYPQYGSAVTIPIGTTAPIVGASTRHDVGTNGVQWGTLGAGINSVSLGMNASGRMAALSDSSYDNSAYISSTNLVADLSNATAASINQIRYAFQVQKWLERANFGSRFFEMLNLHYGVTSPDARLQRPEYLGGTEFYINVDQVLSTAGYVAGQTTTVGEPGAVSVTGLKDRPIFTKAFVEPGYLYIMLSTVHERVYGQGILREDRRFDRFDFYFPEFANLGDQTVYVNELVFSATSANDLAPFGYQEHWAEYRYRQDRVSGVMDPNYQYGLGFWSLAENFQFVPLLNNLFIMENRDDLQRCLKTGSSGPDYIADLYFDYTAMREMPLYTIPGLVDHFGTM